MRVEEAEITGLLNQVEGEESGLNALLPVVYDRLKMLANSQLRQQAPAPTLSATVLVNEAYMRLTASDEQRWRDRQHFFAVATTVIRRIIIDHVRRSHAEKRGGNERPVPIHVLGDNAVPDVDSEKARDLIELDEALTRLERVDERTSRVIEFHVFGGYTFDEIAELLCVSAMTAKRDWRFGRAWLRKEMSRGESG